MICLTEKFILDNENYLWLENLSLFCIPMRVSLREKKLKNGRISLYLDYYPAIIIKGKLSRREFLGLYLEKPKTSLDRDTNNRTRQIAEVKRSERQIELNKNPNALAFETQGDFLSLYKSIVEEKNKTLVRAVMWISSLQYFEDFCNGVCLFSQITPVFVEKYRTFLLSATVFSVRESRKKYKREASKTKKISPNTAKNYFQLFKSVVNKAFLRRLINENPFTETKTIKSVQTMREFLTIDELRILAKTEMPTMPEMLRRVCFFAAMTGLRFSDIERLTWFKVRENENEPFLMLKMKKTSEPIVHPISLEARRLLGGRGKEHEQVFKELRYTSTINWWLRKWTAKAGLRRITFHCFRHTYASAQLNAGTSIENISELLGHSNIGVTQTYLHSFGTGKRKAADVVSLTE